MIKPSISVMLNVSECLVEATPDGINFMTRNTEGIPAAPVAH